MDKVSVYCLDPLNLRCYYLCIYKYTKPVLCYEIFKKWTASKPISWPYFIETSLISLSNNFGTLTLVLGCFPLDIQPYRTMSDYSIFIIALPSANTHR